MRAFREDLFREDLKRDAVIVPERPAQSDNPEADWHLQRAQVYAVHAAWAMVDQLDELPRPDAMRFAEMHAAIALALFTRGPE